ncbi:MAG: DUF2721 domain-containing protein [Verrucomicrobiota bacterium]|nr:DUF2721 domain-containing protein [Verrucomicrobiota bacterium]
MPIDYLAQNPFAALSLIAAPAILTNASSVLALSTSNRFLRAGERMRAVAAELQNLPPGEEHSLLLVHASRIERQALLLLTALRGAYVALGSFAAASLISIVGAGLATTQFVVASHLTVGLALLVGFAGVGGIVMACLRLFRATRLSLLNISEEAALIRRRESERAARPKT